MAFPFCLTTSSWNGTLAANTDYWKCGVRLMLQHDVDVRPEDVQLLASRDALTAFFARLGYDTNERLTQSVAAMNITGESLAAAITHIERIASQDGGFFEVYLFELKSVTVAATQGIVRSFRNRPGDYLLVLTDDYERLDCVLVERYTLQAQTQEAGQLAFLPVARTVSVRPRVLTVVRRNPAQVALRVLRRFSYTESDTFAQYEKLISAYDVAEWSKPYFNNRALFSDYYLTDRLPPFGRSLARYTTRCSFRGRGRHLCPARTGDRLNSPGCPGASCRTGSAAPARSHSANYRDYLTKLPQQCCLQSP